jgi:hypothetical protein
VPDAPGDEAFQQRLAHKQEQVHHVLPAHKQLLLWLCLRLAAECLQPRAAFS